MEAQERAKEQEHATLAKEAKAVNTVVETWYEVAQGSKPGNKKVNLIKRMKNGNKYSVQECNCKILASGKRSPGFARLAELEAQHKLGEIVLKQVVY